MAKFQIFTDSSSDLSKELRKEYGIEYFQMGITVRGESYPADLDYDAYSFEQLYAWIADTSNQCKTAMVNPLEFENKMVPYLEKGYDILYIACSSALTSTQNVFSLVRSELQDRFPDRKMICIDSLIAAYGLGWLTIDARKQQLNGASIEEVIDWVEANKFKYNQCVTVETLTYLKAAGRVKGTAAFFGNLLGVKPIFISDRKGNNFVIKKVKGTKNALNEIFEQTKAKIHKDECNKVVVVQGDAMDNALKLKERLETELGVEVEIASLGPIIGITCGPGCVGTFCYGEEVTRYDGDGIQE
jgi:DegV family protein with EDD domain